MELSFRQKFFLAAVMGLTGAAVILLISPYLVEEEPLIFAYEVPAASRMPASGGSDVPTGLSRSPLFGAKPFTQPMPRSEEFGVKDVPTSTCPDCGYLPEPENCALSPDPIDVDDFISEPLTPLPQRMANSSLPNPWSAAISECLGRTVQGNIEGRPPGPNFSHQRYDEFSPEVYFQSAQMPARTNSGFRDQWQLHQYRYGEFGPGGLYHNTTGQPGFEGTTRGIETRIHPNMPIQEPESVWTFDGTSPPKLLMARYGERIVFRHYNALPIDESANNGFGKNTLSTHLHNAHNPAESDGFAAAFFFPGAFYDYNWPMILAGYDSINTDASAWRAGAPDGAGGIDRIRGDWRETMSTQWFHDHMLDFTAANVYKGNVAMANYYSAVDRGREPATKDEAEGEGAFGYACHYAHPDHVNLCLPSGSSRDWGNRDYDVNLMLADKALDQNGQLVYNPFNTDGFIADVMTVNGVYKPYFEVRARRYRFRILNAAVARYFKIALVDQRGRRVPHYLVGNDGNIMEHSVPFPNEESEDLPSLAIAERYDIIIDFSQFREGDRLYFVNLLEHRDGRGPKEVIDLKEILRGKYDRDPGVGVFLQFRVKDYHGRDLSMDPKDYVEGRKKMIPLAGFTAEELANAKHRTFEFGRSNGTDTSPWTIKTDGGEGLRVDMGRVSAAPTKGSVEIWHLENGGGGWSHPVHIHFEEGLILKRGGKAPPIWERWARKDIYRLGPLEDSSDSVELAIRFREFMGTYMEHCHNMQHEDHSMLLRWDLENPGQVAPILSPIATFDGVTYEDSYLLPTAREGDVDAREKGNGDFEAENVEHDDDDDRKKSDKKKSSKKKRRRK